MFRIIHNKLVRDAVPEIIRSTRGEPITSIVPTADRRYHLCLKLLEEAHATFRTCAEAIRKDRRGQYWLHSWNGTYDDAPVDPETMVPFAHLIAKVGETP